MEKKKFERAVLEKKVAINFKKKTLLTRDNGIELHAQRFMLLKWRLIINYLRRNLIESIS